MSGETSEATPAAVSQPNEPLPTAGDVSSTASESILVNASVSKVYSRCARVEDAPLFVSCLLRVERINECRYACTSFLNGRQIDSIVQIVIRVPDRRISWLVVSEESSVGVVAFERVAGGKTRITAKIRSSADASLLSPALHVSLTNFKRLVEGETITRRPRCD